MTENPYPNPMSTVVGKHLLAEMQSARWDLPSHTIISRTGAVLGTHPGITRRRNEDRSAVGAIRARSGERFFVSIVCDGVGGSKDGDIASTLAVAVCLEEFAKISETGPLADLVRKIVMRMDDVVRGELQGRGTTTASILAISSNGFVVATNVGDSRIYAWSPKNGSLRQVTVDDTMENELRQMAVVDAGMLDAHGLRGSLSQAIGEGRRSSKDLNIAIYSRDDFPEGAILASDGAWKGDESGFDSIIKNSNTALDAVRRTTAFANWVGGVDNISIIALEQLSEIADIYFNELERDVDGSSKLIVWIADTKFSTSAIEQGDQYTKKQIPASTLVFDHEKLKGTIKKLKMPSRKKKLKTSGAEANVLTLASDPEKKATRIEKRIIEISTDENPNNQ